MQTAHRKSSHSLKCFQSKKTPCSRHLMVKLYTLFKTQDLCQTLFSSVYPHRPNKGVPNPGLRSGQTLAALINCFQWVAAIKVQGILKTRRDVSTSSPVRRPCARGWMSKKTEKLKQCVFFSNFSNNTRLARPTLFRFTGFFFLHVNGIAILYRWRMSQ